MFVPEGYTENQLINLIEGVVRSLASHFVFAYYTVDDLVQEGFIFAMNALPRYNPNNKSRCSLENFIRIHVRNRFINLQRNKYFRQKIPCLNCDFYKKDVNLNELVCSYNGGENYCDRWQLWIKRNSRKRDLAESYEYEDSEYIKEDNLGDLICDEISKYVSDRIPLDIRSDYLRFIEGYKLSKQRREYIKSVIIDIIKESPYEGWLQEREDEQ